MNTKHSIYINPLTDFGFKFLFGNENNKVILISFLNSLFEPRLRIVDVAYLDKEKVGESKDGRSMIYDLHCRTDKDEYIIVEMQNRYQSNFKDRAIYYHSKGFIEQGKKGDDWQYKLTPVYGIFITNFTNPLFNDEQMVEEVCLTNIRTHEVFSDLPRMFFLKIPEMQKSADECETGLERWMYIFKNLETMKHLPDIFLEDPAFKALDRTARYGSMTDEERRRYDHSLKVYRDNLAILSTERAEGRAEGRAEERIETIRKMALNGYEIKEISNLFKLDTEEIEKIIGQN